MAWLQSDSRLRNHHKVEASAEDLGISKVQFIGHLHLLWWWVIEYKEKGIISPYGQVDESEKEFHISRLIAKGASGQEKLLTFTKYLLSMLG